MPSRELFAPQSEEVVRESLRRAKAQARNRMAAEYQLAIDYADGRQRDDVESELATRYQRTQSGRAGQQIQPVTVPLVERYVSESADAYSRPVMRKLVTEDGEETDATRALTAELEDMLAAAEFDDTMSRVDETLTLVGSCGAWFQGRAGKLRVQVVYPHDVYPVAPADRTFHDPAEQSDYEGFSLALSQMDDATSIAMQQFAWVSHAQTGFYEARDAFSAPSGLQFFDNPYVWPQVVDTDDLRGDVRTLPLMPFAMWHRKIPSGELIPDTDPDIVYANRELNVQLSVLLDTLAHQGWALPVFRLMDPDSPPATMSAGPRFGISLGINESMDLLNAAQNYTDLVNVLQLFVKLLAVAHNQSPNDFAVDGVVPASGFAKLVDSLPKLEARRRRIARLKTAEKLLAWPRIAAIGSRLGLLSATPEQLSKLRLVVQFADAEFPESIQERVQRETHEIEHGLTTPAQIYAKRNGVSIEAAEEAVAANTGADTEAEELTAAPSGTPAVDDVQKTALNGAQVTSLVEILAAVSERRLPRSSGVAIIQTAFRLSAGEAEAIVGDTGHGFFAAPEVAATPAPAAPAPEPKAGGLLGSIIRRRE